MKYSHGSSVSREGEISEIKDVKKESLAQFLLFCKKRYKQVKHIVFKR